MAANTTESFHFQALKYDEDDVEDKQLSAERHKEEGNKHFKYKKYRWATDCYSEGRRIPKWFIQMTE